MRHGLALVVVQWGCAEEPPDEGSTPPGSGSISGGQTGQSGTTPYTCQELHPTVEVHAFDAPTPLGFSGADAMAAMVPFSATITWSDGEVAALDGALGPYDDPEPPVTYRTLERDGVCVEALVLRGAITVSSDDGRVDTTFVSNDVALWDLGAGRLGETGRSADGWVDVSFLDLAPSATESGGTDLSWIFEVDGAASTGAFRFFDRSAPEGGDWIDVGTW